MLVQPIRTAIFKEGDSIINFICGNIKNIKEDTILVITSKIVALSERRVRLIKNENTREEIIKSESQWAMKTKYTWLTIKDNMVMSSAGIDESNAAGKIILLPRDSFMVAQKIRNQLRKIYKIKNLGIIITDSRLLPLRAGIVGVALGYSGFKGIRDYRGTPDIFGRILKVSRTDVADSLATAAVLTMGEGDEQQPLAIITKAPVKFQEKTNRHELDINIKEDIYQPLFEKITRIKWRKI
jgi:dihydrofolate synthase / folylpolyglutamate synthase